MKFSTLLTVEWALIRVKYYVHTNLKIINIVGERK